MKASELRLGNFIYDTKGTVNTVTIEALQYVLANEERLQAKPIPLTEQWLVRLGFEKRKHQTYGISYGLKAIAIVVSASGTFINLDYIDAPLDYVHQLQNLTFALTGEELEVKL